MTYRLTETYHYTPINEGFGSITGCMTVLPGLIEGEYAKKIMGTDFERAIRLGVLVPDGG